MATTAELVVQGIVAVGGTGVLAAIANGLMSRSKSKIESEQGRADASKVLAEGASILVAPLSAEVALLHKEVMSMRDREYRMWRMIREHADWDARVAVKLRQAGIPVDEPPPLHLSDEVA